MFKNKTASILHTFLHIVDKREHSYPFYEASMTLISKSEYPYNYLKVEFQKKKKFRVQISSPAHV